jgi:hypothetical protein
LTVFCPKISPKSVIRYDCYTRITLPANCERVFGSAFYPQSLPENAHPPVSARNFVSQFTGFATIDHATYPKYPENYSIA